MYLEKQDINVWTGSIYLRICICGGCCEHDNEPSVSIKDGIFLEQLIVLLACIQGLCFMDLVIRMLTTGLASIDLTSHISTYRFGILAFMSKVRTLMSSVIL
jgi:hypothetical protein